MRSQRFRLKPVPKRKPAHLVVRILSGKKSRGVLEIGAARWPCALGRSGVRALKREGDGATPRGCWPIRAVYYDSRRTRRPVTSIALRKIGKVDGWCDDPADRNYNRPVRHPYPASAEKLCRSDGLYAIVVVLGYNDRPRIKGLGSAIFLHVARADNEPTEGCVALRIAHLRQALAKIRRGASIRILT
jgi:L,D-peptidoglycan transpeptidase YkuD (ErfK/YbiS/YcfS/YnhG family)